MSKRLITGTLAALMALSLVACGSSSTTESSSSSTATESTTTSTSSSDDTIFVGIVTKSMADQHWALVKAGAESKAAELGVQVSVIGPNAETDVQGQVDMIDNLIGQEVDVLCVAPSSQDAVLVPFQTADDEGIPIITIDTDTTFENRLSFIGTGNETAAYSGGEVAGAAVGEGATAIIIRGKLGDATHDQREAGFVAALEEAGVEVLEVKAADSDTEKALNIMQDLFLVYDQIDLVCTTGDNMAYGVQRAVEAAGTDTLIMGFDGTEAGCELILEDKMLGSVAQNPFAMGELAVENAVKAVNGEAVEERIDSGSEVVTIANAEEFLATLASLT